MNKCWIETLATHIEKLCNLSTNVIEECMRLTIEGNSIDERVIDEIISIKKICSYQNISRPNFFSNNQIVGDEDIKDIELIEGYNWQFIFGKEEISNIFNSRENGKTIVFFKKSEFIKWLERLDPLEQASGSEIDFCSPVTFIINGLKESFGGSFVWFQPFESTSEKITKSTLPSKTDVHQLIHIISSKPLCISPQSFEISWGELNSDIAKKIMSLSVKVFSAALVHDIKLIDKEYEITLNGTKRLILPLSNDTEAVDIDFVTTLKDTVSWVYSERAETRLKLVMDRLSIDIQPGQTLISGMKVSLGAALQQARDSYAFVILERKDAYHKEMRELMKDMKSQADIYASKVRDLINNLTRDSLGIIVFMGFSFIGRFDQSKIEELLNSRELSLLTKILSIYLLLSCILQISGHYRDSYLSYSESKKWLPVLQNYTSREDIKEKFIKPIDERRITLNFAMCICVLLYSILAFLTWNLTFIAKLLLKQF